MATKVLANIGARLKQARESAGLTQREVASYLGTTGGQVSYWETGRRPIGLTSLTRLSDLYGCTTSWFLDQEARSQGQIPIAFRAGTLSEADLEVIAWARRFARNLDFLVDLSEDREDE